MVVATAAGLVQTFVVAGEVSPTWAQQSPACITQGRHLVAIRSEVLHGCLCMSLFMGLLGKHGVHEKHVTHQLHGTSKRCEAYSCVLLASAEAPLAKTCTVLVE